MKKLMLSLLVVLSLVAVGCGDDDAPAVDGGGSADLGQDMNVPDVDMGPEEDMGPADDMGPAEDMGPAVDGGPETACVTAGGTCVPVTPGSCTGIPSLDSCGPGVGTTCCLPGDGGVAVDGGP